MSCLELLLITVYLYPRAIYFSYSIKRHLISWFIILDFFIQVDLQTN